MPNESRASAIARSLPVRPLQAGSPRLLFEEADYGTEHTRSGCANRYRQLSLLKTALAVTIPAP